MKMLWILRLLPFPPISGYRQRVFHLLKRLSEYHEIYILSFRGDEDEDALKGLAPYCREIRFMEGLGYRGAAKPAEFFLYLLKGIPPELRLYHNPASVRAFTEYIQDISFDLIQFEDSFLAIYLSLIPSLKDIPKTLIFHDIIFEKMNRSFKLEKKLLRKIRIWLYSRMMRTWEPSIASEFDLCVTMSKEDTDLLKEKNQTLKIAILPNGVDTKENMVIPFATERNDILFVGHMGYLPNVDAMDNFVHEILPLIWRVRPKVTLWIVGMDPAERIRNLSEERVIVTGRVESVKPYYARSSVFIVPLRAGGGTRLKILEAMALGRPVVSTSVGCEGLNVEDGKTIFIADDPETFAKKVIQLLDDQHRSMEIAIQARELVVNQYDWDIIAEMTLKEYNQICK